MIKTVEAVAAALRAHRDASEDGRPGCVAYIAPKVEVLVSTLIGNFVAVIPVEIDDPPGSLKQRYAESISFTQHDNAYTKSKAERFDISLERFGGNGLEAIKHLRGVAKDIEAFCDAVELVWRGGEAPRNAPQHSTPPTGYLPCTREDGHPGPCAHPLAFRLPEAESSDQAAAKEARSVLERLRFSPNGWDVFLDDNVAVIRDVLAEARRPWSELAEMCNAQQLRADAAEDEVARLRKLLEARSE